MTRRLAQLFIYQSHCHCFLIDILSISHHCFIIYILSLLPHRYPITASSSISYHCFLIDILSLLRHLYPITASSSISYHRFVIYALTCTYIHPKPPCLATNLPIWMRHYVQIVNALGIHTVSFCVSRCCIHVSYSAGLQQMCDIKFYSLSMVSAGTCSIYKLQFLHLQNRTSTEC